MDPVGLPFVEDRAQVGEQQEAERGVLVDDGALDRRNGGARGAIAASRTQRP
ncbi:MAG: hypothetical protein ACRDNP_03360 [Gaiellaceae bacterium]